MARPTKRSGSSFGHFRMRVPDDVQKLAKGQPLTLFVPSEDAAALITVTVRIGREINVSLRTRDAAAIKARHAEVLSQVQRFFASVRNGPIQLTHKRCLSLAGEAYRWYASTLEDDPGSAAVWQRVIAANDEAMKGPTWGLMIASSREEQRRIERLAVLEKRFGGHVDLVLRRHGLLIDVESRQKLLLEVGKALTQAAEKLRKNAEGDYRPDQNADRFPSWSEASAQVQLAKPSRMSIDTIFQKWQAETNPAPNTVSTFRGHIKRIVTHIGHDDAARWTEAELIAWKDALIAEGLKSVNTSYLGTVRALLQYAVDNRLLQENVALRVRARQKRRAGESRLSYSTEEVVRLLDCADKAKLPYCRWLPWLLALSGARVGEVAQLWGNRVFRRDGIWVMDLQPAPDGGTLKNAASERLVPIHPLIIDRGFIKFCEARGSGPLFYGPCAGHIEVKNKKNASAKHSGSPKRHTSKSVTNRLAAWVRDQGFTNKRVAPNHGLRSWFRSELIRCGVQDSIAEQIIGHAEGKTGNAVYIHATLTDFFQAISKVQLKALSKTT